MNIFVICYSTRNNKICTNSENYILNALLTSGYKILVKKKHLLCIIICIDFLAFVAAKLIQNLTFIQLLSGLYQLKIRIYVVYTMLQSKKIYTVFREKAWTCSHKNVTNFQQKISS